MVCHSFATNLQKAKIALSQVHIDQQWPAYSSSDVMLWMRFWHTMTTSRNVKIHNGMQSHANMYLLKYKFIQQYIKLKIPSCTCKVLRMLPFYDWSIFPPHCREEVSCLILLSAKHFLPTRLHSKITAFIYLTKLVP